MKLISLNYRQQWVFFHWKYSGHCSVIWDRNLDGLHPPQLAVSILLWTNTISLHNKHDKREFTSCDKMSLPVGMSVGAAWSFPCIMTWASLTTHTSISVVLIFREEQLTASVSVTRFIEVWTINKPATLIRLHAFCLFSYIHTSRSTTTDVK